MNDYEYTVEEPEPSGPPLPHLTPRQRTVVYLLGSLANDLALGSTAEAHTAALMRLLADAISRQYEAELVVVAREWRRERERAESNE